MDTLISLDIYDTESEDGHPQWVNNIAFHVTLRTILARLPDRPGLKILDIGGGTGQYSFALAERGHSVTLVDISASALALAERYASSASASATIPVPVPVPVPVPAPAPARILQGDATRLANHPVLADEHGTFDAVLLLRPLACITSPDLRATALGDAWDYVSPRGGVLFCGWASWLAHYRHLACTNPAGLSYNRLAIGESFVADAQDELRNLGDLGEEAQGARYYELPERMPDIMRDATGIEDVEMVGAEAFLGGGLDKMVNELQGEEFEAWVEKCLEIGTDEYGWRMADHVVGIAIKP